MRKQEYSVEVGGATLTTEFSDLAEQANGSVILRYGNTVLLATAVMSEQKKDGDFFPLTVDYEERFYATGKILGSRFMRREGRPSDEAVLSGRIVDRTIRPLFKQHIRNEVQVVITVLSLDEYDPDVLGVIAASLALGVSDIPWDGPVSAVRVAKNSDFHINPSYKTRAEIGAEMDLVACGKEGTINMIEVGSREIGEGVVTEGLERAAKEIEKLQEFQHKIIKEIGKKKRVIEAPKMPEEVAALFEKEIAPRLAQAVICGKPGWENIKALQKEWLALAEKTFAGEQDAFAEIIYEEKVNEVLHTEALLNNRRPDGRGMDEVRPLYAKAGGLSPILHGSGIFYRGGTHIFSALTLGGPGDSQIIDGMETQMKKQFMHHYNFPPYSSGETGRIGSTNRRMIGHGALAEKALVPVLPPKEKFPYTIRIVSEAFASNGSTSMGSVCGSSLALMDAGVPITRPVAGIASGLIMDGKKYKILTDIQGPEDHHGDMDFKVAGTREGVTAIQMDVKVGGVPIAILSEALEKAKRARLHILDTMEKEISEPRKDISPNAPKIICLKIKPDQIGMVIGTGGKVINEIKEDTGVEGIDIEDDGSVFITGKGGTAEKAAAIIAEMTHEYKAGERFTGTVVKLAEFGAFVSIGANTDGLVHVSEIAPFRIERVESVLKVGDKVPVIIKEVDPERGRIKLSIKDADPSFIKQK